MPIKGHNVRVLIDQYDFSGDSHGITINTDAQPIEYSVFQTAGLQKLPNLAMASIEHAGYFSGAGAGLIEQALHARLASATAVKVGVILGTDQTIPVAYVISDSFNQQLKLEAPLNDLLTIDGKWPVRQGQMYRGYQVYRGTISATGALTGIDFGAAGAAGGKAWLFVTAIGGTASSAGVKVQSANNSGFTSAADEGTFTFSAVGAYEVNLSGAVDRYIRLNCTTLGGATSFAVVGVVALSGVNY